MKHVATALIVVGLIASSVGCSGQSTRPTPNNRSTSPPPNSQPTTPVAAGSTCGSEPQTHRYWGVIEGYPGNPSYQQFLGTIGLRPTIDVFFLNFGRPWNPSSACWTVRHGALPLLQFNPRKYSVRTMASGAIDGYIMRLAHQVRAFCLPILISLGHEMNGNWYPWGWTRTPAATFVKMWRHVHDIFASQKASNVIWMWTVNRAVLPATRPGPWWPGRAYVNWVGIDGHLRHSGDTFKKVFDPTIAEVRRLTGDPILISEVAVVAGPQRPARIADLYRTAAQTPGVIGVLFLNMWTVRIDWRLQDTASLRAFAKAVKAYSASAGA